MGGNTIYNIEEERTNDVKSLWETGPKKNSFVNGNMKPLISHEFHASAILAEIYIRGRTGKSLALLRKQQATRLKKCIYSTYSPPELHTHS
jgi:hypothetical protein